MEKFISKINPKIMSDMENKASNQIDGGLYEKENLLRKLDIAIIALEFYGSAKKYHGHESSKYGYVPGEIINDNGDTARDALALIK